MMLGSDLIRQLRAQAGRMAYGSVLYNWSLGSNLPTSLAFKPTDPWLGDLVKGRALAKGRFSCCGEELAAFGFFWRPENDPPVWLDHLHKFEWLRDLRALGGDAARFPARAYITNWVDHYHSWDAVAWEPDRMGRRLSTWISLFDFYGESADEDFQDMVFDSIIRQARHLYRVLPGELNGYALLEAIMGLIYAGLAIPGGERWLEHGLNMLLAELDHQILRDGGHISRNPETLLKSVMLLTDLRCAILSAGYPLPEQLQHALDRAGPALRFFRHSDKNFACFNGAQEGDETLLERVILQIGAKGKIARHLPDSGYERLSQGRTLLMIDCAVPPEWPEGQTAHVAPGAFELSYGRERIFVNCGTHPSNPEWADMLRGTAAHNALSIDHRNACEIRADGHIGRKPRTLKVTREDVEDTSLVTLAHDGYVPVNGIRHQRRIYLGSGGHDIRGEETLSAATGNLSREPEATVRFHLHPRVVVSLVRDGEEALLRMPGGTGWRFYHEGTKLALENSVYLGQGTYPRKTKQLVLTCTLTDAETVIQWALQKEG